MKIKPIKRKDSPKLAKPTPKTHNSEKTVRFSLIYLLKHLFVFFSFFPSVEVKIGCLLEFFVFPIGWGVKTSS
jgi:hypothetical protein